MIKPLRLGRVSIKDQATARGLEIPVNRTVAEIKAMGFDVDPNWRLDSVLVKTSDSPTGYAVEVKYDPDDALYALAH